MAVKWSSHHSGKCSSLWLKIRTLLILTQLLKPGSQYDGKLPFRFVRKVSSRPGECRAVHKLPFATVSTTRYHGIKYNHTLNMSINFFTTGGEMANYRFRRAWILSGLLHRQRARRNRIKRGIRM